jgi:N-acetylglucosaminyldiphosphoundecaprenol N-acetyl-beta-D-mannosaminyltransferase
LVATGRPALVVASSGGAAEGIRSEHPQARVVVAPMLPAEPSSAYDELAAEAVAALEGRRPDFVFVTLGIVKQELIIDALLRAWPVELRPAPVMLAVGASFDMYYGLRARAPGWVQRAGLEWFFRFVQEPRRLFRRYFIEDLHFVPLVWREWRANRVSAPAS